jgi:uncharacterized protein DUF4893
MLRLRILWALAALAAAACQTARLGPGARPSVTVEESEAWRSAASARDAAALDGLAARWTQALAAARGAGLARRINAEGPLLAPAARLARAAPAPGSYRCRSVRLAGRRWAASAPGFCYVGAQAGELSLATELRGLRLGGYLWEIEDGQRLVFLGAPAPASGKLATAYGEDPARDAVGLVERIGDFRYRLVLPDPAPGAGLTFVELVAAPRP